MKKLRIPTALQKQMTEVGYSVRQSISRGNLPVLSGYLPAEFSQARFLEFLQAVAEQIQTGKKESVLLTLEFKPLDPYFAFLDGIDKKSEESSPK